MFQILSTLVTLAIANLSQSSDKSAATHDWTFQQIALVTIIDNGNYLARGSTDDLVSVLKA